MVVDGVEALAQARREDFDALVLDVMMPGVDGLGVCRVLRADGDRTPVLMLTARVETPDRVAGLDAGADDYLPKPFELDELLARLRALLRRASPAPTARPRRDGARCASPRCGSTRPPAGRGGREEELELSKTEFDLLELLVRNDGIVLDHSTIYDRIWGYDFGPDSKNLAVYIGYLRRKLAAAGAPDADPHRPRRRLRARACAPCGDPTNLRTRFALAFAAVAAVVAAAGRGAQLQRRRRAHLPTSSTAPCRPPPRR